MSINTKLVLLLTLAVGGVMLVASFLSLREREAALGSALRDELRAHAVTLKIALEEDLRNGRNADAQVLINRLRENSRVYAVLLFDENAVLQAITQPGTANDFRHPAELDRVLRTAEQVEFFREVENRRYLSIILPLLSPDKPNGAVEIVKPLALIEDDITRARLVWLTTTLLLLAAIFLVVFVVLRQGLSRPIRSLLLGARTLGGGDLSHRVEVYGSSGNELTQLAAEFNRMADNLDAQRQAIEAEATRRLNLEKQLRHSERLASVGRIAAGIAHELGAPLNVIDARAEQLIEKPEAPREKQIKNLDIIRAQSARIAHIVRQLLNLARPYDLRRELLDADELIGSAINDMEPCEGVTVDFESDRKLTVAGDADFLRQVLVNVFRNAQQAIDGSGVLKVRAEAERREGQDFTAIRVSDTGGGIASEDLDKIFDPFFTTKEIGAGTGLGLAVSRRIVEEHGGTIEASNNVEGGATFTIHLPAR